MDIKLLICKIKVYYFPKLLKKGDFNYILEKQGTSIGKGTVFFHRKLCKLTEAVPIC